MIVVDDGSNDGSRELLAGYAGRVRTVLKSHGGHVSAVNAGVAAARGGIVCLLDADDSWLPEKVARVVAAFDQRGAGLVCHQVGPLLKGLSGWSREGNAIVKTYRFANYHETMAFVNAAAWVSHREDHHPDLAVGYNQCRVSYHTHDINGLSENDFICAAKIHALLHL